MDISVIIPCFNLEAYIGRCLKSILTQDYESDLFEIIVVLDACADNSLGIVTELLKGRKQDKIARVNLRSPGLARNVGLDMSEGEYICFIDGDDYLINRSALTLLYNAVQGHNAVRVMDHEKSGKHVKFSDRLTLWLHFFSRELIGNERFKNILINEDYEFVKRIRSKAEYDEVKIWEPLYFYNYNEERMIKRIMEVCRESEERVRQGLPPLCVDDEFVFGDNPRKK